MKQNSFFIAIVILFMAGLTSCSKEKVVTPVTPTSSDPVNEKLLMATNEFYSSTILEYYPDRKLKKYVFVDGGSNYRYEFSYQGNVVTDAYFYNNVKQSDYIFTLNNKGYATSMLFKDYDANGNTVDQNTTNYTYNVNGQLVKETFSNGGHCDFVYDNIGNMTELHAFNTSEQEYWVSTYEYYTDKAAKRLSYGQLNSNGFGAFLPLFSKYLIKHQVAINKPSNTVDFDGQFTYEFDNDGFITKGQWINAVTNQTYNWANSFQ